MIQRILNSKNFVACLLAAITGMALYFKLPFPTENAFLQLMALRAPLVHEGLFYSYNLFFFMTPYIAYRFCYPACMFPASPYTRKFVRGNCPPYPDPRKREELFVVVGEVHNKRKRRKLAQKGLGKARVAAARKLGSGCGSCCVTRSITKSSVAAARCGRKTVVPVRGCPEVGHSPVMQ
jgi:hypothetical protein